MDAKIAVNLDHIDLGNAFSRPIAPLKANLLLQDGKLSLTDIYARTADGTVSGTLSINTHASAKHDAKTLAPTWQINLNWKNIDLDKWLRVSADRKKEAKQAGKKDTPPSYVTGKLNGKSKLIGSGNSTAEMLSTLDGEISIYINKGTISHLIVEALGLDIAQGLGLLLTKDESLPMQCAVMDLTAKNGIATPTVALIDTPVTLVLISGTVNLAKETLDLTLAAKPKNVSPFTVRSPIHVKGSFKHPDVSVEKTPIVARVLGSIALAFVNPLAAILPFIDTGSGEKSPCNASLIEFQKKS
jgi:AsmA protein